MDNDDFHQVDGNVSAITTVLEDKGVSWGSYQEDMPYTGKHRDTSPSDLVTHANYTQRFLGYEGFQWLNQQSQANDYVRKCDEDNQTIILDLISNIQANTTLQSFMTSILLQIDWKCRRTLRCSMKI